VGSCLPDVAVLMTFFETSGKTSPVNLLLNNVITDGNEVQESKCVAEASIRKTTQCGRMFIEMARSVVGKFVT